MRVTAKVRAASQKTHALRQPAMRDLSAESQSKVRASVHSPARINEELPIPEAFTTMPKLFHPLLKLIASATDAKFTKAFVQTLKNRDVRTTALHCLVQEAVQRSPG